jgi:phosphomannomutase/phosphoglucomutase
MAPITKKGYLVPGDQLLALFGKRMLAEYPGAALVTDIKCSASVLSLLTQWGGRPHLSPSGHAIMKNNMQKHQALLGGELSCHFFFNDRFFGYDDGIYAAMRLLEIVYESEQTLDDMLAEFPQVHSSPEILLRCDEERKRAVIDHVGRIFAQRTDITVLTIDGIRACMPYGWGIVRSSNTRPMLTIRFESETERGLQQVKHDFIEAMSPYFDRQLLQEQFDENER